MKDFNDLRYILDILGKIGYIPRNSLLFSSVLDFCSQK